MANKVWLITGVSSGLGRDLVIAAAQRGNIVVGTVRKNAQIEMVDALLPGQTFGCLLDVNNHEEIKDVVNTVYEKFGRIDVLVNNAGYGFFGAIEEATMSDVREQMETNFFGAYAMTKSVLPIMRNQKSGHIIQVSSQAGLSSAPGLGVYNASKYALEGFSEALYKELLPMGIHVTLIEPGPFRTDWAGRSMRFASQVIEAYHETAGKVKQNLTNIHGLQPGSPVRAAEAILKIVESNNPPLRLPLGRRAVETIRHKLEWVKKEIDTWEIVSVDTDFPN